MKNLMILAMLTLVCVVACDRPASKSVPAEEANEGTFDSPQEKTYTLAGRPFAEAIAKQDYAAAYQMLHPVVKRRLTLAQFIAAHNQARVDYFVPASTEKAYVAETDPAILSGRVDPKAEQIDKASAAMAIARQVGDVPSDIPIAIRRAALTAALYDRDPEDSDCRCAYLNYLLVEENGQYSIAHWFYRWHDMLD